MDERVFDKLAAQCLLDLERAIGAVDPGLEVDLSADILQVQFESGGRPFIINSHRAARQIWVAAELRAWHFSWNPEEIRWVDTREGRELVGLLQELLSKRLGRAVRIVL